jgi:hypothetical protein
MIINILLMSVMVFIVFISFIFKFSSFPEGGEPEPPARGRW